VSVIHFDAHLDTWAPWAEQERITHGTFFHVAREEGLLSNTSVHAGIRCKMTVRPNLAVARSEYMYNRVSGTAQGEADLIEDEDVVGFKVISTDDLDDLGIDEVIRRIRARIKDSPVYLRQAYLDTRINP
jgi:agmatinase